LSTNKPQKGEVKAGSKKGARFFFGV
jgi:hypothetical protein